MSGLAAGAMSVIGITLKGPCQTGMDIDGFDGLTKERLEARLCLKALIKARRVRANSVQPRASTV